MELSRFWEWDKFSFPSWRFFKTWICLGLFYCVIYYTREEKRVLVAACVSSLRIWTWYFVLAAPIKTGWGELKQRWKDEKEKGLSDVMAAGQPSPPQTSPFLHTPSLFLPRPVTRSSSLPPSLPYPTWARLLLSHLPVPPSCRCDGGRGAQGGRDRVERREEQHTLLFFYKLKVFIVKWWKERALVCTQSSWSRHFFHPYFLYCSLSFTTYDTPIYQSSCLWGSVLRYWP